jgi:hypothetical protein
MFTNLYNRLGFLQANLKMVKDMPIGECLKELNLDTIDITKVPILLGKDERIEDYLFFYRRNMHKDKIVHENVKLKGQCLWQT